MIVIDASVLVAAVAEDDDRGAAATEALASASLLVTAWHAVTEAASGVRGLWRGGRISAARAVEAMDGLVRLEMRSVAPDGLLPRAWELRHNLTVYDAVYVALAEAHDAPLVTMDRRITASPGIRCRVVHP